MTVINNDSPPSDISKNVIQVAAAKKEYSSPTLQEVNRFNYARSTFKKCSKVSYFEKPNVKIDEKLFFM